MNGVPGSSRQFAGDDEDLRAPNNAAIVVPFERLSAPLARRASSHKTLSRASLRTLNAVDVAER